MITKDQFITKAQDKEGKEVEQMEDRATAILEDNKLAVSNTRVPTNIKGTTPTPRLARRMDQLASPKNKRNDGPIFGILQWVSIPGRDA